MWSRWCGLYDEGFLVASRAKVIYCAWLGLAVRCLDPGCSFALGSEVRCEPCDRRTHTLLGDLVPLY